MQVGGLIPPIGSNAEMVELVYTLVLETSAARLGGSSPSFGTNAGMAKW